MLFARRFIEALFVLAAVVFGLGIYLKTPSQGAHPVELSHPECVGKAAAPTPLATKSEPCPMKGKVS